MFTVKLIPADRLSGSGVLVVNILHLSHHLSGHTELAKHSGAQIRTDRALEGNILEFLNNMRKHFAYSNNPIR